ncbi:MAG: DUF4256 domain-containing protein [Acidobacteria bacterium]|nr:DUF4256 domain-containing protein [Acidobacteriota bacterium]
MAAKKLAAGQGRELVAVLQARFAKHPQRHQGIAWAAVEARLEQNAGKLSALAEMERTGGEPDVIGRDEATGEFLFVDCAAESPAGRRSLCFDEEARKERKEHPPKDSAMNLSAAMGVEILTEAEYRRLQELGEFDLKTSSWVQTPPAIRKLGGALFCDRRYDTVFVYHNGAQSYYAARGFRGLLRV